MNIVQGGSGFPVLSPALYKYMCTGEYLDLPLEDINVPHRQARHLILQVCHDQCC